MCWRSLIGVSTADLHGARLKVAQTPRFRPRFRSLSRCVLIGISTAGSRAASPRRGTSRAATRRAEVGRSARKAQRVTPSVRRSPATRGAPASRQLGGEVALERIRSARSWSAGGVGGLVFFLLLSVLRRLAARDVPRVQARFRSLDFERRQIARRAAAATTAAVAREGEGRARLPDPEGAHKTREKGESPRSARARGGHASGGGRRAMRLLSWRVLLSGHFLSFHGLYLICTTRVSAPKTR